MISLLSEKLALESHLLEQRSQPPMPYAEEIPQSPTMATSVGMDCQKQMELKHPFDNQQIRDEYMS